MIESLPTDILNKIFFDFSSQEWHRLQRVSRSFLKMVNDDKLCETKLNSIAAIVRFHNPYLSSINVKLVSAAYYGLTRYVAKFLCEGADANVKLIQHDPPRKPYHIQPIHYAASCGNPATVKVLIKHHAIFKAPKKVTYYTSPLHFAVANGRLSCIRLLLKKGANVNQPSGQPFSIDATPIQIAAMYNQTKSYTLLRTRDADIHINGHIECADILAKYATDYDFKNSINL